jgi:hypothetical protein
MVEHGVTAMLKKVVIAASALVVSLVTLTLVVLLGTVTHADAVGYADWVDATKVTDPMPGQLYAVSAEGGIEGQLCLLNRDDFNIRSDALPGRTFVNRLGEAVPVVLWAAQAYFQTDPAAGHGFDIGYRLEWRSLEREFAPLSVLTVGVKRILHERDLEQIKLHASAAQFAEVERLEGCANAIVQTFRHGFDVCQLTEVIRERTGGTLAVRFATHCLTDLQGDPRRLPELAASSLWTSLKLGLGLVDQLLALPVLADQAAG